MDEVRTSADSPHWDWVWLVIFAFRSPLPGFIFLYFDMVAIPNFPGFWIRHLMTSDVDTRESGHKVMLAPIDCCGQEDEHTTIVVVWLKSGLWDTGSSGVFSEEEVYDLGDLHPSHVLLISPTTSR